MCLEERQNETVGLYPTFLAQEIMRVKNDNKYNNTNTRKNNKCNTRSNRI